MCIGGRFRIASGFVSGIRTSLRPQRQGTRVSRLFVRKLIDRAILTSGFT
jgi:hypothetical protein